MIRSPRVNFSKETKRLAFERSRGICECHLIPHVFAKPCGCKLVSGQIFYEHIDPSAISRRNDLANAAALTKTCWLIKSNGYDKPVIAKSNRVQDRARGIYKDRSITGWRSFSGQVVLAPRER